MTEIFKRHIAWCLITLLVMPFMLTACSDDFEIPTNGYETSDELPVEFEFLLPEDLGSRGFAPDETVKTKFEDGDVIHLFGTFKTRILQENGNYIDGPIVKRYGALKYNGKLWRPVEGSTLTWPSISVSGTFVAYYIKESNGVLNSEKSSETYNLSSVTPSSDPLKAESEPDVPYGNGLRMRFGHLCAYLALIDLEPMVAERYWFLTDNVKESADGPNKIFNNAFKISLNETTEGPEVIFEFCQVGGEKGYENLTYIAGNVTNIEGSDQDNNLQVTARAGFFLEPGFYESFELVYPSGQGKTYSYLEYNYKNVPDNSGGVGVTNTPPDLKANKSYTLTITKSPGITVNTPPVAGGWDESETYFDIDVEEFLKAINDEKEYKVKDEYGNDVTILEETPNGTKLLHNVDFKNFDYSKFNDQTFRANNMEGSVFDGDYHYIRNLGSPLFRYNFGTIQNLGIKGAKIERVSYEDKDLNNDMSRNGALCMWNRSNATISNVRLSDVEITIYIKSVDSEGQEAHNIGGIVGANTGVINGAAISGTYNITVTGLAADNELNKDKKNYPVNASVLIGGIAGQNAGEGDIYDVSPLEGSPVINIYNNCVGPLGAYSVGGVIGESQGYITGVILPYIKVDATKSSGLTSYIGGIVGQLAVSTDSDNAVLNECVVSGTVRAGVSQGLNASGLSSVSFIGGVAGTVLSVPVLDCSSAVSVYATTEPKAGVLYGTGGAFGRIRKSESYNIKDITAYGNELIAPAGITTNNYYGSFAGIVPAGQTWIDDYSKSNITIHRFPNMSEIGGDID